jgi:FtsP/CotA-like multicopper oxidase with cupredoxin domain
MSWRRPVLLLLLVMLAVSALSAPRRRDSGPSAPAPAAAAQPPVVHATLPAADDVRVRDGRVVELRVTSLEPDIARIDALGLQGPVGPDLNGPTLRFVAGPPGRYPVRLDVGGTRVGTIEVVAAKGS